MVKGKFELLNLKNHFNADAISYDSNPGDGHFGMSCLPAELLPDSNSIVEIDNIPFLFPSKEDGADNNIELNDQVIEIPKGYYPMIHVLGSCDNGSFKERFQAVYDDHTGIIKVGFTDWILSKPLYNETVAFSCDHFHSAKGDIFLYKVSLWVQSAKLDKSSILKQIILPNNPCFHIFSITLEKADSLLEGI